MDYKYIEQLIERYFDCMTTIEEEQILRSFFCQEDVPAYLMQYRDIFVYESEAKNETLNEEFDTRILSLVEGEMMKDEGRKTKKEGRIIRLRRQLAPLLRAAAIVTVIISVGNIAEHSMYTPEPNQNTEVTAISPYIRSVDVDTKVMIKDVSRAEVNPSTDSIPSITSDNDNEIR